MDDEWADEVDSISWFQQSFRDLVQQNLDVPWALFWVKVKELVASDKHHYNERWAYDELPLFDPQKRIHFQEVLSAPHGPNPHQSGLSSVVFEDAVQLLPEDRQGLATLFREIMSKRWSNWMPNGSEPKSHLQAVHAPSGQWIVGWQVGLGVAHIPEEMLRHPFEKGKIVTVELPLALRGKASGSAWFTAPSKKDYQRVEVWKSGGALDSAAGFTTLTLQGRGCLTSFMNCGIENDVWKVDSDIDLSMPGGLVVGYQLRVWGYLLDGARFLFKDFSAEYSGQDGPSKGLSDQAFLCHTGQDEAGYKVVTAIYQALRDSEIPAFLDFRGLPPGTKWRNKLILSAKVSKAFIVVISPSFGERFWPMHELDIAITSDTQGKRKFFPVLVHLNREGLKSLVEGKWYNAWVKMADDKEHGKLVNLDKWKENLNKVMNCQAVESTGFGVAPGINIKGTEQRLAEFVAKDVSNYVRKLR